jgi:hypothetical protein
MKSTSAAFLLLILSVCVFIARGAFIYENDADLRLHNPEQLGSFSSTLVLSCDEPFFFVDTENGKDGLFGVRFP